MDIPVLFLQTIALLALLCIDIGCSQLNSNTCCKNGQRIINTNNGKVRGLLVEFPYNENIRPVEVYPGLRYASLRRKTQRFMPPQNPLGSLDEVRLLKFRPACRQRLINEEEIRRRHTKAAADRLIRIAKFTREQAEDCLSLNIFVPVEESNGTTRFPVMVFLHGESYDSGTGNAYDGSVLAGYGRVIVVTLNYRLGVLGYLATKESGNYALLDIIAALHWIQDNIASFSGDPGRVTLFGHGYGAALVNLLLISPLTKDRKLFQRGILQSGSALSSWAVADDPVECTRMLANAVNCSQNLNSLMLCLQGISSEEMILKAPEAPKFYNCFAPSVRAHDSVIPFPVEEMLRDKDTVFAKGSLMFGLTSNEAVGFFTEDEAVNGFTALRKAQLLRTYVHNTFKYHRQKIYEILDHHYTDWSRSVNNITRRNTVMDLLSDGLYTAPLVQVGNYHSKNAPTYFYNFAYSTFSEDNGQNSDGVHGDELPYVFGAPLVKNTVSPFGSKVFLDSERQLSEITMTYWTNFAKSGNPNRPVQTQLRRSRGRYRQFALPDWPQYSGNGETFLQLSPHPKLHSHYRGRHLALWLDLTPKLHKPDGLNPKEHLLKDSHNVTTFDSPSKLVHAADLFPIPITTEAHAHNALPGATGSMQIDKMGSFESSTWGFGGEITVISPSVHSEQGSESSSASGGSVIDDDAVQVSITIAVGCSLLLINLLIFAGIYYQRERIKRLQRTMKESDRNKPDEYTCHVTSMTDGPNCVCSSSVNCLQNSNRSCRKTSGLQSSCTYVPMPTVPSTSNNLIKPTVTVEPCLWTTNTDPNSGEVRCEVNAPPSKTTIPDSRSSTITMV